MVKLIFRENGTALAGGLRRRASSLLFRLRFEKRFDRVRFRFTSLNLDLLSYLVDLSNKWGGTASL